MSRWVAVQFRGEDMDVVVDSDTGYDHETNSREIEWHFFNVTPEQHEALAVTDDEEIEIYNAICQAVDGD